VLGPKSLLTMDGDRAPAGDEADHREAAGHEAFLAPFSHATAEVPQCPNPALTVLARALLTGLSLLDQRPGNRIPINQAPGLNRARLPGIVEGPGIKPTTLESPEPPAERRLSTSSHAGAAPAPGLAVALAPAAAPALESGPALSPASPVPSWWPPTSRLLTFVSAPMRDRVTRRVATMIGSSESSIPAASRPGSAPGSPTVAWRSSLPWRQGGRGPLVSEHGLGCGEDPGRHHERERPRVQVADLDEAAPTLPSP
jgi:hypothetical protein